MSNYTTQSLLFSFLSSKKVEADFDGGEVTSDAGVLLLRETESQIGIISAIAFAPDGSLRRLEFFAPQKLFKKQAVPVWFRQAVRKLAQALLELQTCEPPTQKFYAFLLKGATGFSLEFGIYQIPIKSVLEVLRSKPGFLRFRNFNA